jgi:hypothetical protein
MSQLKGRLTLSSRIPEVLEARAMITENDRNHDDHDIMISFCCSIVADDHDSIFVIFLQ